MRFWGGLKTIQTKFNKGHIGRNENSSNTIKCKKKEILRGLITSQLLYLTYFGGAIEP